MAGVPSRSKMYRTSAISGVYSVLHFAQKNSVYTVHLAKDIYILLAHLQKMYIVLNLRLSLDDNRL
jgi:hypothetical protein